MLNHAPVLVVEDETFIALDLAFAIEDAGGEVVGPVSSVKAALALLEKRPVAAAILDVNLTDQDISPVVDILSGLGVPIIVQTGVGLPPGLLARFPNLVVWIKPYLAELLVSQLATLIANNCAVTELSGEN